MLKETTRYQKLLDDSEKPANNESSDNLPSKLLPAVEELTLGLKHKLHLHSRRNRHSPYYNIKKQQDPVDQVERLLKERALVAEAVRRLQDLRAKQQQRVE